MQNSGKKLILWVALAAEVTLAVFCLLITRNIASFLVIFIILSFLGAIGFVTRWLGWWTDEPSVGQNWVGAQGPTSDWHRKGGVDVASKTSGTGAWNFGGVSVNLNNFPERSEVIEQVAPISEEVSLLAVNVVNGGLRVVGQEGLKEIRIKATRRIRVRDEEEARAEFDKLRLRHWQEGSTLRIEAGDPEQGIAIGRGSRIDLELLVPPALAANLTTGTGDLSASQYHGHLTARTTLGAIAIEEFNSGRNLTLSTMSGRVSLQGVAAGQVKVKAGAGMVQLTGVGAEGLDLEATAGSVRTRGVNCGRYVAYTATGNLELYEAQIEFGLELKAGVGRIHAETIKATAFKVDATTGSIVYRGDAPTAPSEVTSGIGSVDLMFKPGAGFNLEARSSMGSVDVFGPVSATDLRNRTAFQGQLAGGGAPVRVVTQVGSVRVTMG